MGLLQLCRADGRRAAVLRWNGQGGHAAKGTIHLLQPEERGGVNWTAVLIAGEA